MEQLGFAFRYRAAGLASLALVVDPVSIELCGVQDLIDLQRQIGLPLKLEDGVLEVIG